MQSSGAESTVVSFIIGKETWQGIPSNGTVDIQMQAFFGNSSRYADPLYGGLLMFPIYTHIAESDWSNIQTISIPDGAVTIAPYANPTLISSQTPIPYATTSPTPTVPEFSWLAIFPLFVSVLLIEVMLKHRKTLKTTDGKT